uniref:N-alpha-acetyltransferase 35, NatC auxiliary subunit n=1 Tax=Physcomitrium patens TaxID=3218 RepID=A0A7I4CUE3_PHYPA
MDAAVPAGDQTIWLDASSFLSSVCNELSVGELVHGENFRLFEAMSALEIMDPKMDAGMATTGFKTFEEAIESGAAPIELTIPQLVDVFDHILACEATWQNGHALAQTVFSCLYLLNVDRTAPNALLHAFCKTTRASCSMIRTAIALADIHEQEEDFITMAYGLPVEGEGDSRCLALLNTVEEVVARQLRGCKGGLSTKKKSLEDAEPLQDDPALEEGYCHAILCRLRFRKALYHILTYMDKPQGRGLEMARKHILVALSELQNIRSSSAFLSFGQAPDSVVESKERGSTASGRVAIGFDECVNRRLLAPTPPRSISILSWEDTLAYFEKLLQDLDRICSLPMTLGLEEILQFVMDYQKLKPDLFARARLQLLLLHDGKLLGRDPLAIALVKVFNVPQSVMANDHQTQAFTTQAARVTKQLLKIMCTNTAWQRRKLGRILQDWGNLLQQSKVTRDVSIEGSQLGDEVIQTENMLTAWVAEQTCWVVRQFLMLGFQLDLYSLSEFCMVYWYLDHVLLSALHYKLAKESQTTPAIDSPDSVKKKGKKKKGSAALKQPKTPKDGKFMYSVHLLQCYSDLCKGFIWMLTALTRDRKLLHRETIFNTEQEVMLL